MLQSLIRKLLSMTEVRRTLHYRRQNADEDLDPSVMWQN